MATDKTIHDVNDVAAYILQKQGEMTTMKMEKLAYYAQAWSLVWHERPLFAQRIEAWIGGPIVPALYEKHHGQFTVSVWQYGNADNLDDKAKETLDAVLEFYGAMSGQELSDLTHAEQPWIEARQGLAPTERGSREITHGSMYEYYESLPYAGVTAPTMG